MARRSGSAAIEPAPPSHVVGRERLRFAPDILRRLGEELNPNPEQGIIELVRNAYDADALTCVVELENTSTPGGTVRVTDDGVGMDPGAIANGWLILGRSSKGGSGLTPLGRLQVGDKGLGRLAALRLGSVAELRTRPSAIADTEYEVVLDWGLFDDVNVVEDVGLDIEERPTTEAAGTSIEIRDLRPRIGRRAIRRLARQILLLAAPFEGPEAFRPRLVAPGFEDLERLVAEQFFGDAEFYLSVSLRDGEARAELHDWRGDEVASAPHDVLAKGREGKPYAAPSADFEMWVFILDASSFARRKSAGRVGEIREWLGVVGGVHIYHRGLRVHPYGDPGHDWLELNLRRARDPEYRPSTNTSLGRVVVDDPENQLTQKTDRSGFIEDEAFSELRDFVNDALEWMHDWRYREARRRRDQAKRRAPSAVSRARRNVERTLESLPPEAQTTLRTSVQRLERAHEREARILREDVQLYRTLSTIGTTTAVFAHESARPIELIGQSLASITKRSRSEVPEFFETKLDGPTNVIERSLTRLRAFAALPLRLLQRQKRRVGAIDVHDAIKGTIELFEPFLRDAQVATELQLADGKPRVRTTIAALESIIANFVINSIRAFNSDGAPPGPRKLVVRTDIADGTLLLQFLDTGPGIPPTLSPEDVWLPGRTTIEGGTGLGLTIVRDAVTDMEGRVHAQRHGELGGAEFSIELPLDMGGSNGRR